MDGLFQRFMVEVDRPILSAGSSPSSSATTESKNLLGASAASYRREDSLGVVHDAQPRDYEVLAELSLLAWGDAWVAAGTHHHARSSSLTKYCGGGWNLKGSAGAWSGLRCASSRRNGGDDLPGARRDKPKRGPKLERCATPGDESNRAAIPLRMVGEWADVCLGGGGESNDGFGLRGRSAIRPNTLHGVMRYWVQPRWDPRKSLRGKLPGLGMSGDVRFFVRWHTGSVGYCSLMTLGRPLKDICEV